MSGGQVRNATARGCGYVLLVAVVSGVLLVVNGMLLTTLYSWMSAGGSGFVREPALAMAIVLGGPVLLTFAEWWAFDRAASLFQRPAEFDE